MNPQRSIFILLLVLFGALATYSQTGEVGPIRSSAAYSEVLLRRTQLQADLEALVPDYTEANPKIIDLRTELAALTRSGEKMYNVKPSETGKLTLALGKLIVEQARLQTDLARLLRSYGETHAEVKRAKRKVEVFESAINEILK
jgi:uncharacterized protein involved in exopolysaccharide biosynthesis